MVSRETSLAGDVLGWTQLATLLERTNRALRGVWAQHATDGELSDVQFRVMWACHCAEPPGVAQSDIAALVGLSTAHVSGLVEQLRTRGLLVAQRSALDRRRQCWQSTAAGEAALAKTADGLGQICQSLSAAVTTEERQYFHELLQRLEVVASHTALSRPRTGTGETMPVQRAVA